MICLFWNIALIYFNYFVVVAPPKQHVVQAGVNPFHPAAAAFPQPTAHTAESLSAAVAAKSEQIAAAHKQDASGGGAANQIPGSQVSKIPIFWLLFLLLHTRFNFILEHHQLFIGKLSCGRWFFFFV